MRVTLELVLSLSQKQRGQERVIPYFGRTLSRVECNYCVTRREILALVKGIEHFHYYLYGRRFVARTDCACIRWLLNFRRPEGQIAQWVQKLRAVSQTVALLVKLL